MRLPTLRQLNGFVMIVNTLLPGLVILLLGAMLWSTAVSFKRNTCAVITHVAQATNDKAALDAYLDARSREDEKAQDAAVSRLIEKLRAEPQPANEACGVWDNLRDRIKALLLTEFFRETAEKIELEVQAVKTKVENAKEAAAKVVPKIPSVRYSGIKLVDHAIWAVNKVIKVIGKGVVALGEALKAVGNALVDPFTTAKDNLWQELGRVDYKRAVTWGLLYAYASDTVDLFDKFGWLFVALVLWLVFSYALWVQRRFAVGWALLCDRPAA